MPRAEALMLLAWIDIFSPVCRNRLLLVVLNHGLLSIDSSNTHFVAHRKQILIKEYNHIVKSLFLETFVAHLHGALIIDSI
jgi:hypothetical protein